MFGEWEDAREGRGVAPSGPCAPRGSEVGAPVGRAYRSARRGASRATPPEEYPRAPPRVLALLTGASATFLGAVFGTTRFRRAGARRSPLRENRVARDRPERYDPRSPTRVTRRASNSSSASGARFESRDGKGRGLTSRRRFSSRTMFLSIVITAAKAILRSLSRRANHQRSSRRSSRGRSTRLHPPRPAAGRQLL